METPTKYLSRKDKKKKRRGRRVGGGGGGGGRLQHYENKTSEQKNKTKHGLHKKKLDNLNRSPEQREHMTTTETDNKTTSQQNNLRQW